MCDERVDNPSQIVYNVNSSIVYNVNSQLDREETDMINIKYLMGRLLRMDYRSMLGTIDKLHDKIYLLEGTEKSSIKCIELEIECFPMFLDRDYVLCEVPVCETCESTSMGGKYSCWEY